MLKTVLILTAVRLPKYKSESNGFSYLGLVHSSSVHLGVGTHFVKQLKNIPAQGFTLYGWQLCALNHFGGLIAIDEQFASRLATKRKSSDCNFSAIQIDLGSNVVDRRASIIRKQFFYAIRGPRVHSKQRAVKAHFLFESLSATKR